MHTTHPDAVPVLLPRARERARQPKRAPGPLLPGLVGTVQALIGLSALISGGLMVARPDGGAINLKPELLQGPFHSFLVPGLVLGGVIGGMFMLASWLTLGANRFARLATLVSAVTLVAFIATQVFFLAGTSALQLVCLFLALGLAAMATFSAAR